MLAILSVGLHRRTNLTRLAAAALLAGSAACAAERVEQPALEEAAGAGASAPASAVVADVIDGDTIELADGRRVRLVQIDSPELGSGECHSRTAARELQSLLPAGARIRLKSDPRLDKVDRYGRLLRYVFRGGTNVNLVLVRRGAASVWLYRGERGRYAGALLRAAQRAKAAGRGLWGACPGTALDPLNAVSSRQETQPPATQPAGDCDPSYPDVCIPPYPPDLDCGDIPYTDIRVVGRDPHGFDGNDDDGVGCES